MKGSALEFALAVDQQIAALPREAFYRRTGRSKRLQEELYPLSRFALHLMHPGVTVQVEAFENDGPIDGVIRFSDSDTRELRIEVTYIHSYEAALRRELLWTTGSTPVAGSIHRDKSSGKIVAISSAVPTDEEIDQLAADIVELYSKKRSKNYARGTILLITFEDPTFFGQSLWRQLLAAVDQRGGLSDGSFAEVHVFNCGTNDLLTDIW